MKERRGMRTNRLPVAKSFLRLAGTALLSALLLAALSVYIGGGLLGLVLVVCLVVFLMRRV